MNTNMLCKYFLARKNKRLHSAADRGVDQGFKRQVFVMRLIFALTVLGIFAAQARGYSQKIKIDIQNAVMAEVLEEVRKQSGLEIFYNIDLVETIGRMDVRIDADNVEAALRHLMEARPLGYSIQGGMIVVFAKDEDVRSVQTVVRGRVKDPNGNPLEAVSVFEQGTDNGTSTDANGHYTLTVISPASMLVFSSLGYRVQQVAVGAQRVIDVVLMAKDAELDEVVVVGYGTQKKINLTGAVSTIAFGAELENRPITNASQALGGTASGVWVSQNSGKPGGDGAQLRVRGWGTLNDANPLVIVDGVEGNFDQLNPNDIESVSVFKDAASSAIYGSKAANGVVLVTTKQGKIGKPMEVAFHAHYGLQSLGRHYDMVSNSAEHMELTNLALRNEGSSPLFSDDLIASFRNGQDPYKYPNTDWFNTLFATSPMQEHNVSVTGGSAVTSSFISANYLHQDGMVPNTKAQRYGIRANVESNVNDWLTLGTKLNYQKKDNSEPYADVTYGSLGRVFEMLAGAVPYIAPYTRRGEFGSVEAFDKDGNMLYDNRNPLIDAANGASVAENHILTVNLNANVKLNEHWSFRNTFSSNGSWLLTDRHNISVFGYSDAGMQTITRNFNREGLEINRAHVSALTNNFFSTLNFSKTSAGGHAFSGIAGVQLESATIRDLYGRRSAPPKEGLTQVDAGTTGLQNAGNLLGLRMFSYFSRVNYDFKGRYLFEANLRADVSSRFRKGKRWGMFPGFSAGWRLSDEEFVKNIYAFPGLKLRASWGQLGNQSIEGYWPYLTVVSQNNELSYSYNGTFVPGAAVTGLVDPDITWETASTFDIGLDMALFDHKINIEADYFRKKTADIIVQLPVPLILGGVAAPYENVGEMVNNGFELVLNYTNRSPRRDKLGFQLGVNLTYIDNKVAKFRENAPDQLYLIREGYSYRTLYGYKSVGIYQSDEEAKNHMHSNSFVPKAGNLKFEDTNGDGRLTFEDKQVLGNTIPKITFGFSPRFTFRGFDLNMLFQGIGKVSMYTQNGFTNMSGDNRAFSTTWRRSWTPESADTDVPSIKFDNSWDQSESSYWVNRLSYAKLKNAQLGYAFGEPTAARLGVRKIYVYANAQNVFSWVSSDYEGYDPERNTFDSGANLYPIPRILSFGVNVKF